MRCTCLGNATPDCGAPDLPRSLFPALPEMPPGSARPVFYLYGPLCAYPPRFRVGAALVAARLAGGLGEEERGGRGQAPPLRVSVGRAGPMGTRCSTRRGSRPKPQKKIAKMVLTGYFEIGYNIICIVQACTV